MTDFPESHRDLLNQPIAILSTVGRTGIPQTTPIWFFEDGGELHSWLSDARQKVKNLMERPEFSLLVIDPANPFRYLVIRGRAELELDPDHVWADKMGAKYDQDMRAMLSEDDTRYHITFWPNSVGVWPAG